VGRAHCCVRSACGTDVRSRAGRSVLRKGPVRSVAIDLESVRAAYESRTVLFDISCSVRQSECLGIFGHNGAGKSTLLRVLAGSVPVKSGQLRITTADGMRPQPVVRLVPQEEMVFEHLTVRENLVVGVWNDRNGWRNVNDRIDAVCTFLPAVGA